MKERDELEERERERMTGAHRSSWWAAIDGEVEGRIGKEEKRRKKEKKKKKGYWAPW